MAGALLTFAAYSRQTGQTALMRHTLPIAPQFYVTAPQPCPYLEGRMERKLFTALQGDQAQRLNDALSKQGFRRSPERALPPVLRRMLGLPVGAHPGGRFRAHPHPEAAS